MGKETEVRGMEVWTGGARVQFCLFVCLFVCLFIYLNPHLRTFFNDFRERKTGMGGERERNIDWLLVLRAPTRDRIHNPGMCPDKEWNVRPFGLWSKDAMN